MTLQILTEIQIRQNKKKEYCRDKLESKTEKLESLRKSVIDWWRLASDDFRYIPVISVKRVFQKQVGQSSDNRCVLWRTARVLVFESSFKWHTFLFLMLFCSNSAHFLEVQLVCDRRTDGRTDGPTNGPTDRPTDGPTDRRTDGRTDTPSYRDARTHLKSVR